MTKQQPKWQKAKITEGLGGIPSPAVGKFCWVDIETGIITKAELGFDSHEKCRRNCTPDCRGWLLVNLNDELGRQRTVHQFRLELQNKFRREVPMFSRDEWVNNPAIGDLLSDEEEAKLNAQQKA